MLILAFNPRVLIFFLSPKINFGMHTSHVNQTVKKSDTVTRGRTD